MLFLINILLDAKQILHLMEQLAIALMTLLTFLKIYFVVAEIVVLQPFHEFTISFFIAFNHSLVTLIGHILTNATSVGMAPNTDNCIIDDESVFRKDLIVSDVIYNPRETKLVKIAKEHGCTTFNGLYMLLYQGAKAFEIWTGKEMPVDQIKAKYFS